MIQLASHHGPDQAVPRELRPAQLAAVGAVAEGHRPVGEGDDLREAMGDPQDGHPARREATHDGHELLGLPLGQGGGGLIEDEDAGIQAECLRNLHELLGSQRQGAKALGRVHLEPHAIQDLERPSPHGPPIQQPAPARLSPQEDVLLHRQVVTQAELLMDEADPRRHRLARPVEAHRLTPKPELPGIRRVDPGQDPHEGALARTVLAHDRQDLAGSSHEVHALQGLNAPERLGEAASLQHDAGGSLAYLGHRPRFRSSSAWKASTVEAVILRAGIDRTPPSGTPSVARDWPA